jgi:hypothetical protein
VFTRRKEDETSTYRLDVLDFNVGVVCARVARIHRQGAGGHDSGDYDGGRKRRL